MKQSFDDRPFNPNDRLNGRKVVVKIAEQNVLTATVVHYDAAGYWFTSNELSESLVANFQLDLTQFEKPVIFVPLHRLEWLLTASGR